jgi:hypothetical protein
MTPTTSSSHVADDDPLTIAARQLLTDPGALTAEGYERILQAIRHHLARWFPHDQVEELSLEVVAQLLEASRRGGVGHQRQFANPVGYVLNAAKYSAFDQWRFAQRRSGRDTSWDAIEEPAALLATDDEIAKRFDQEATAQAIRQALAAAAEAGDATAVRVVTYILDRLEQDDMPSNRAVSTELGLSHTGVAKALARFRAYLEPASSGDLGGYLP